MDELPDSVWQEAIETVAALEDDPFPEEAVPLRGHNGLYRVPFYRKAYRIMYLVSRPQKTIVITRVRNRSTVYRGL